MLVLIQQAADKASSRVRSAAGWLRDNARPPEGTRLQADGVYSGLAIVDRNTVVVLIAARHGHQDAPSTPIVAPRTFESPPSPHSYPESDPYSEPEEPVYRDGYRNWDWNR